MYKVRFVDPQLHYSRLKGEIDFAITDCLTRGDLIYRQQLKTFEENLASFVGTKYAVGVGSGYHALLFSLIAAGIGAGDEVITVAHTFLATISAIVHAGAKPILISVGSDYNINPSALKRAITPRTKAVIPVHLNGRICQVDQVMDIANEKGLVVIEDAAQSLGARFKDKRAGGIGSAGCFSFYPFKILGGFGDGGAVTTNDVKIARTVSLLRYNGEDRETGEYHMHGQTALLDNVQAAVLDVKLKHLPSWIDHRREMALRYRNALRDIRHLQLPHFSDDAYYDVFQNYVIRTTHRDSLRDHLRNEGIETLVHWPKPVWEHQGLKLENPNLPETDDICRQVISLPMSAELTAEDVDLTADSIRRFFSRL